MLKNLIDRYKAAGSFKKRGIIYISIAALFISFELMFSRPVRPIVVMLWIGVVIIGVIVLTQFKDKNR
jgi:hypothetical protein